MLTFNNHERLNQIKDTTSEACLGGGAWGGGGIEIYILI